MIKIFVSSTFVDMHAERDAIQMFVLPKIRKIAEQAGEAFDFCDLRWGINTDDKAENECMVTILETCFREIKKCKPYMIVLLGERYGSTPGIDSDVLLSCMNADEKARFKYDDIKDKSYTGLEVLYGPLSDDEQFRRTIFMFREPIDGAPSVYCGTQDDREKIAKLKESITKKSEALGVNNVIDYKLEWDKTAGGVCGIERFVDLLSSKIDEMLSPVLEKFAKFSQLEKTIRRQWLYVDKKAKYFFGMDELLQKSEDMIDNKKELIIRGTEGSGKSCLLSKLAQIKKSAGNVFPYICECGATREEICSVWVAYLTEIMKSSNCGSLQSEDEQKDVWDRLYYLLDKYDRTEGLPPLYFFVDGAEKVNGNYKPTNSRYSKIAFIYSHEWDSSSADNEIFLESSQTDAAAILTGNMRFYGKDLPKDIIDEIVAKYGESKPIAINLLFCRLALLNASDFADGTNIKNQKKIMHEIVAESPLSEVELSKSLIALISERTDKEFIDAVVKYLAASFSGLRREDLRQLLKSDGIAWQNAYYSVLIDYFNELFYEHVDGRVEIEHSELRNSLAAEIDVAEYRSKILRHLKSLPAEDGFRKMQIYRYCRELNDGRYLMSILQNDYNKSATFVRSMGYEVRWLNELIENGDSLGADIRFVRFINNVFCRNVIAGTMDLTAGIIKNTLKFLESHSGIGDPCDCAVLRYHLSNFNELYYDDNRTYKRFRYIEKTEGEEFADTLYDYLMKLKAGYAHKYADDFLSFIEQNDGKIGAVALLYCCYIYSKYGDDDARKKSFKERCLNIIAGERYIDEAFTYVAIGVIDDLCGNELWSGKITACGAENFDKYEKQIVGAVQAFGNSRIISFYLNSCIKIAAYHADNGNSTAAEKYCSLVAERLIGDSVYNTQEAYDLLNRAMFCRRTAGLCHKIGNNSIAAELYDISIKSMTDYFVKYKVPNERLPEETYITVNKKGEFIQPRVVIAEDYAALAEVYFDESDYARCLDNLTGALAIIDAFNRAYPDDDDTGNVAHAAFVLLNKLIETDAIKAEDLAEPVRYVYQIGNELGAVLFADFVCHFHEFAVQIVKSYVKSCIRRGGKQSGARRYERVWFGI